MLYIVLFLHQTTTILTLRNISAKLYIVLFLHQTTTFRVLYLILSSCISYYSYIKPQPAIGAGAGLLGCISYYSYIKPQLMVSAKDGSYVVYRTIPTSNHNQKRQISLIAWLYIVLFLHQTTTLLVCSFPAFGCISYYSYIKPQLVFLNLI